MVKRASAMAFAGGMAVFPGGRVDDDDVHIGRLLADDLGLSVMDAASRIAAIRETLEETGLPIGIVGANDQGAIAQLRQYLLAGGLLSRWLNESGSRLDLSALAPFARWRPDHKTARLFNTRFYVSLAPDAGHTLSVNSGEHTDLFWESASSCLARASAGEIDVIFPTFCNLQRLAQFGSGKHVIESAQSIAARRITPWVEKRGDEPYLCIPGDRGYPVTEQLLSEARRG